MLRITIIAVGKLKEDYWRKAAAEYQKRLSRYCRLELIELADEPTPEGASPAQEDAIREREGTRIIKALPEGACVLLDIGGKSFDSPALARALDAFALREGRVSFIIGGSLGVSGEVRARANERWSFSQLTFPHQLARILLLEQLYRGFRILSGEPYHK